MAFFDSQVSKFQIDDIGTTLRDISAFMTEIDGLPGPRNLNPVTALGDAGVKHQPSLEDVSISLSGTWDNTATTGLDVILGGLRTHNAAVDFEYGPEGTASGDFKYSGTCWVENYTIRSQVGNVVSWSATLRVEGVVTRGAY